MYCRNCGSLNIDNAWKCVNCGTILQGTASAVAAAPRMTIPSYLAQAIILTIVSLWCCLPLPLGVVAIVYAAQVNSKFTAGDIAGAQQASKNAKMWCWITLGTGLLVVLVYIILLALGVLSNMHIGE